MSDEKPRLLIISFSDIAHDARVKKQVNLFAERYRVTTCGFGDPVRDDVQHIRIEPSEPGLGNYIEAALARLHLYSAAYRLHPRARAARKALKGRRFDAVVANDIDTLGVAFGVTDHARVHADLHEYFPGLHDHSPVWVKVRKPFNEWVLRRFAVRAGSATTVSDTIAERYVDEFGLECGVVRNAAPFFDLQPQPVGSPIRIVHSGGAQENRRIEVMMEAVALSDADVTLDLYLTGAGSPYMRSLEQLAERLGNRVTVHPPVSQAELVPMLNSYDVGIHVLPRTNTNNALALPNKFFDYVQARLAMVIGPTADMKRLLNQYELGVVAEGYDVPQVVDALNSLTVDRVTEWKRNAVVAAPENCAEAQQAVWEAAVAGRLAMAR